MIILNFVVVATTPSISLIFDDFQNFFLVNIFLKEIQIDSAFKTSHSVKE